MQTTIEASRFAPWENARLVTARKDHQCDWWFGASNGGHCAAIIRAGDPYVDPCEANPDRAGGFGGYRYCLAHFPEEGAHPSPATDASCTCSRDRRCVLHSQDPCGACGHARGTHAHGYAGCGPMDEHCDCKLFRSLVCAVCQRSIREPRYAMHLLMERFQPVCVLCELGVPA